MKTVLFVSYSMGIGGVEKALLGVAGKFVQDGWTVHIALIKPEGEFLAYLPNNVTVHKIDTFEKIRPLIHTPMKQTVVKSLKNLDIRRAVQVGVCLLDSKINGGARKLYDYAFKNLPLFSTQTYDLAVAFAGPDAFIDSYTNKCIKAREKWGWIHFDITKFGIDRSIIADVYQEYTRINIVSEQAKEIFDTTFPQFAHKTYVTPNIIDESLIKRMAEEEIQFPQADNKHVILTVGRISKEKGQFKAIQALEILVKQGFRDLQWWFVGAGTDMERCKAYVHNAGLDDYVIFVGPQVNPYPYMKHCDLYVQPSEHEGFCITLAEAKLFGMPIVATNFTGAKEQLESYSHPNMIIELSAANLAEAIESSIYRYQ